MNRSTAIAVAQSANEELWDAPLSIPTDDSAVLTTFLPLATVLVVYGAILLCSLRAGEVDTSTAGAPISRLP